MATGYPQVSPAAVANMTPIQLDALFATIRSQIIGTSTLIPDPRALLCIMDNPNHDYKFSLDYTDATIATKDLKPYTDLEYTESKYYSRFFHCKNRYIAERMNNSIPDSKLMDTMANIYRKMRDGNIAAVLSDTLRALMGTYHQQIADWYPYDGSIAPKPIFEDKTRAQDGWIDMYMPGTDTIESLTPETPPYKFFPLLDMFASKQSKDLANGATSSAADIVLCDKDYFQRYYNALVYRGGNPNMLIDRDQYAPLAQSLSDAGAAASDFTVLRIGSRFWAFALYGDRDAMGTPSVFLDFLEADTVAGHSRYPVAFAACRNTWYSTYAAWPYADTVTLEKQPHTTTFRMAWQNGTGRMPGATQGAMWVRVKNSTLLAMYPNLDLYKNGSFGMNASEIEKFYTDAGEKDKGMEYKKNWEEYAKSMSNSPVAEERAAVADIETSRGSTKSTRKIEV